MYVESVSVRHYGPFREAEWWPGEAGPGVIAITGRNGAGKTLLLEAIAAAWYQALPSRGDAHPIGYATSRDSQIRVQWIDRDQRRWAVTLALDATTRQTQGVLAQAQPDGSWLAVTDGRIRTLREALATRLPPYAIWLVSAYGAQGRGDLLTRATPSARQDLLIELLRLDRLIRWARLAQQVARALEGDRSTWEGERRARLEARIAVPDAVAHLHAQVAAREAAQAHLEACTAARAQAEATWRAVQSAVAAHAEQRAAVERAEAHRLMARERAMQRLARLEAIAEERTRLHETGHADRQALEARLARQIAEARDRVRTTRDSLVARRERLAAVLADRDAIEAALADEARLSADLAALEERRTAEARAQAEAAAQREALAEDAAALARLRDELVRAEAAAATRQQVPCRGEGVYARCPLLESATTAAAAIPRLREAVAREPAVAQARQALAEAEAAREAALRECQATWRAIHAAREALRPRLAQAALLDRAEVEHAEIETALRHLEIEAAQQVAALVAEGDAERHRLTETYRAAEARLDAAEAEARTSQAEADQVLAEAEAALAAAEAAWARMQGPDHGEAERLWREAVAAEAQARQALELARVAETQAQDRLAQAEAQAAQIARLDQQIGRLHLEMSSWDRLAARLGKGGLVDLEIDAAGPRISTLATELLDACFGSRFVIELLTQIPTADGSRLTDRCTVRVADTEAAGLPWREITDLSGGERTLVQEAIMLALASVVADQTGQPMRTLCRDETGAALDPDRAAQYIRLLQRARQLSQAEQILVVTHAPAAAALADAELEVRDGHVSWRRR